MLEKDGLGQRSGVRPVRSSVRSQKNAKVRCCTVSSRAWIRGAGGEGAVATDPLTAKTNDAASVADQVRRGAAGMSGNRGMRKRSGGAPGDPDAPSPRDFRNRRRARTVP